MVARLIEGWESSTVVADYAGRWTVAGLAPAISSAYGRYGNGLRLSVSGTSLTRTLDAQATWVAGFAFRAPSLSAGTDAIFALLDGAVVHCGVSLTATTGFPFAWRGTTATVLGTSASALSAGVWYYLEVKATIADSPSGALTVRVNGTPVLTLSGIDTRNAGNASANAVRFGAIANNATYDLDDLYIFDGTGSLNNDLAGDCRVQQVVPGGAGASAAWTPSAGGAGSNFQCVDEVPPNADTDYVSSATAGQTDTYAFGDLAVASGAVKAVQATARARKDDAGSRSLALVARPGSTDRVGTTQTVGDAYAAHSEVWNTNPDTSAAWTVAEVNASAFGVRLIA